MFSRFSATSWVSVCKLGCDSSVRPGVTLLSASAAVPWVTIHSGQSVLPLKIFCRTSKISDIGNMFCNNMKAADFQPKCSSKQWEVLETIRLQRRHPQPRTGNMSMTVGLRLVKPKVQGNKPGQNKIFHRDLVTSQEKEKENFRQVEKEIESSGQVEKEMASFSNVEKEMESFGKVEKEMENLDGNHTKEMESIQKEEKEMEKEEKEVEKKVGTKDVKSQRWIWLTRRDAWIYGCVNIQSLFFDHGKRCHRNSNLFTKSWAKTGRTYGRICDIIWPANGSWRQQVDSCNSWQKIRLGKLPRILSLRGTGDCERRKMPCLRNCLAWVAGQVGADGLSEDNCVSSDRFDSLALKRFVFIAACVSLLTASIDSIWSKLCVVCGRKCLHAVVRAIRLACSRSFVCLFWPQTRTPTRSRWLLWVLCLLQIYLHQNIFFTKLFVTISNQSSWGYNLCVICGHKCFPAVGFEIRLTCSRSFVCLFWPQTQKHARSRWLLWMVFISNILN